MLRGFATINYWAADLEAAKHWYAELLGVEPYFERAGSDGGSPTPSFESAIPRPITPRGDQGFVTAAVVDPFGNVLGIMNNPHYVQMLRG